VKFEVRTSVDANGDQANTVVTNADKAIAVYTKRVENSALWDASFQEAMVYSLAVRVCAQVNGSQEMLANAKANANALIQTARANDGNEGLDEAGSHAGLDQGARPGRHVDGRSVHPAVARSVLPRLRAPCLTLT